MKDEHACWEVTHFYKRWSKYGWNARQAADALSAVVRTVTSFVGPERAKEILP